MADRRYDGLLLDHDGVLVSLCAASTLRAAAAQAFADVGVPDPRPADLEAITIRVSPSELRETAGRYDVDPERLWQRREDRIEAALRAAVENDEKTAYDDIACLERAGVPLGIVSNNQRRIVEFVLGAYGISEWFEAVHARPPTVESLHEKKPEPTYLEAAATGIGCSNPLYVGDSESDVVAGRRAGVDTVLLRRGHNADRRIDAEPLTEATSLDAVVDLL